MQFYAKIHPEDKYFIVSFPDFPNVNTYGNTIEDALINAEEALNASIESDFQRGFTIPAPKIYKTRNHYPIQIKPHIEIALNLRKLRSNLSQSEIAKKLGISYQAYQKLENPRKCNPSIKTLEKIARALNKTIELCIR